MGALFSSLMPLQSGGTCFQVFEREEERMTGVKTVLDYLHWLLSCSCVRCRWNWWWGIWSVKQVLVMVYSRQSIHWTLWFLLTCSRQVVCEVLSKRYICVFLDSFSIDFLPWLCFSRHWCFEIGLMERMKWTWGVDQSSSYWPPSCCECCSFSLGS